MKGAGSQLMRQHTSMMSAHNFALLDQRAKNLLNDKERSKLYGRPKLHIKSKLHGESKLHSRSKLYGGCGGLMLKAHGWMSRVPICHQK